MYLLMRSLSLIVITSHTSEERCLWIEGALASLDAASIPASSNDSNLAIGASEDDFCCSSPPLALDKYEGFIGSVSKLPGSRLLKSWKWNAINEII